MASFLNNLNMGGYGIYVWPSYGLVAVILALQWFIPWQRWRKLSKKYKARRDHAQTQ